jgi:hypothetical protein
MKALYLVLIAAAVLLSCSQQDTSASVDAPSKGQLAKRARTLHKGQYLIKQNKLSAAYDTLSASLMIAPSEDTLYFLHNDLSKMLSPNEVERQARALDKVKGGWAFVKDGKYDARTSGLHFEGSAAIMSRLLLEMRPQLPALSKAHAREKLEAQAQAKKQAKAEARLAAQQQAAIDAENYEKRGKVAAQLRETFLDNNMDVEVKVSGKNRSRITLTYALMGAVLEHKMEKEGNISTLLDLGFKEVELTDGYDFDRVWRRHN